MEQMPSNSPVMESKPGSAGWLPVWIKAVTKPNEQTFVEITEHPDMSSKTAYIWVFIAGTISGIIQAIATTVRMAMGVAPQFQIPGLEQYAPQAAGPDGGAIGVSLITGLCVSPIAGLLSVLFFAIFVAIIQWIAKLFGGTGTYDKLLYAMAAISVPFTLVSSLLILLGVIPFVGFCFGILSFGLGIYALVLQVMAVKGVNRFGWGPAIGSVFIPFAVILIICACVVIGGLMLLGPAISNTFNQINQTLTP
jgi:Flp pilus assembly pilin Flp